MKNRDKLIQQSIYDLLAKINAGKLLEETDEDVTAENEIEMLRNQLEIAHAHITRLESKYEGVASEGGEQG